PDTSTFATVSRAKEWLSTCTKHHGDCLVPARTELPSRVLVVSNHKVILRETKGEIGRYVALSHCWGRNPVVRTLRANIRDHKENIPWPALSKTFQDAIILTWRLGFHYLWIDSLCIIQDDPDDWAEQASRMAQVFSNAQLTIAASRAADGAGGCFTRYASEPFTLVETDGQVRAVTDPGAWAAFVPAPATTDRDGATRRLRIGPQIEHGLTRAPLLQRAWVLQEQVLSPRLLHFACGELYWECVSHVACECRGWERRAETLQSETRLRKAHGRLVELRHRHRRGGGLAATAMAAKAAEPLERSKDFEAYRTLVEQYMDLDITNDADRLPALSGITFGRPHDEYLAGMWRSMLIESLHWSPSRRGAERRAYRPATYRAPSWSWASIEGHITHVQDFAASSYRSDDNAKPKATVIAVSCTPEGIDVRGRIKGGYLRIRGPIEEATVSKVRAAGANDRAGADTCAELVGKHGHIHGTCLLDVPLVSARGESAEVKKSGRVLCLQISTSAALVLKSIASPPGSYTRVGILITDEQTTHAWFTHSRSEAVFIS
ncbi:heterokaryon incompatibility protein-domain-containing protein, partial [Dactylonectria macrodidyma]